MSGFLCSMVGASFITVVAEVIRRKIGISAAGNAQIDTAQSKFGGASALFDGTTDYLFVTSDSTLAHGAGNFTIEMWVRFTSQPTAGNYRVFYDVRPASTNGAYPVLTQKGTSIVYYANSADRITSSALTTNTWYHLAVSRSGTDTKMFIDGTQAGSTYTDSTTYLNSNIFIGGDSFSNTSVYAGYIDELRISDTARYTTTFTPSTTPFVNDANTKLLLHMDGTDATTFFEDDNGTGRSQIGITAAGNAQIDTAQSQFGGSSALFDGTGDYLTTPYNASIARFHDNTNYTIEYWVRVGNFSNVSTGGSNASIVAGHQTTNGDAQWWSFGPISDGNVKFYYWSGAANQLTTSGVTLATNTWYHLAAVKSTNSLKIYVNGIERASGTISNTPQYRVNEGFILGMFNNLSFNGHLDEVRISNSARYTAGFTPSTTPFVNDANTFLLLHMDSTDATTVFRDDNGVGRSAKGILAIGNAQIDTAQSKFGGSSALFDGTGDLLQADTTASLTIASSEDFTIEGWIRPGSVSSTPGLLTDRASSNSLAGVNWDISIFNGTYITSRTNTLLFETGSGAGSIVIISNNNVFTTNTWYHFAVVRSSNVITLYVNGTDVTNNRTGTQSSAIGAGNLTMGGFPNGALMYTGHMDEIRWSNSARYTTTFTPSTTQFQNDSNTKLLMHMDGTDASTVFVDDNGVSPTHSYT